MSEGDQRSAMLNVINKAKQKMVTSRAEALVVQATKATTASFPAASSESVVVSQRPPRATREDLGLPSAKENRGQFIETFSSKVEAFVHDPSRMRLEFPAGLSGYDRKTLHQLAAKYNLSHSSEGNGYQRRLVLTKDSLFFSAPNMRPSEQDIELMKQRPPPRHFHHQDNAPVNEKEQYADRSLYKNFKKFNSVTDPTRNAVANSMSTAELQAMAMGGDGVLALPTGAATNDSNDNEWSDVMQNFHPSSPEHVAAGSGNNSSAPVILYEVCTVCGTSALLDYEISKWDCQGLCETCGRTTLFVLKNETELKKSDSKKHQREVEVNEQEVDDDDSGDDDDDGRRKVEVVATSEPQRKSHRREESPKDSNKTGDSAITVTTPVADIVNLAQVNELHDTDVAWIDKYCTARSKQNSPYDHVMFCFDFSDFLEQLPAAITNDGSIKLSFARVTAQKSGVPVTPTINNLLKNIERNYQEEKKKEKESSSNNKKGIRDVFVGFSGSVGGTATDAVVAVALPADASFESVVLPASDALQEEEGKNIMVASSQVLSKLVE